MKSKKVRFISSALLVMALMLSGCNQSSPNNNMPTPQEKLEDTIHIEPTGEPEEVLDDDKSKISDVKPTNTTIEPQSSEPKLSSPGPQSSEPDTQDHKEIVNQLISKYSKEFPDTVAVLDTVSGDIGNDGVPDIVAVLQYKDHAGELGDNEPFKRIICIFTKENDNYVISYRNNKLVPRTDQGGVYGDPYEGIAIKDGSFALSIYGGSSYRWGYVYTFQVINNDLVLVNIVNNDMSTHTGNGTETTYDFINGTVETYSNSEWEESYVPLIMYRGTFKPILFSISEVTDYPINDIMINPEYPMPSLDDYDYFGDLPDSIHKYQGNMNYSAEEILDIVKNKYYPNMKKIKLTCEKEILDNYSALLDYQVPDYYYENEDGKLTYFSLDFHPGFSRWEHTVMYNSITDHSDFYWLWDDTGEEKTFD